MGLHWQSLLAVLLCNVASPVKGLTLAGRALHRSSANVGESVLRLSAGFQLDLQTLRVHKTATSRGENSSSTSPFAPSFAALTSTVSGHEVACVNCNGDMFSAWLEEQLDPHCRRSGKHLVDWSGDKHPNAPGYKKWAGEGASLLSRSDGSTALGCRAPTIEVVDKMDQLEALRLRLPGLWAKRQLIVGMNGPDPLSKQMDFVEALSTLARRTPQLVPKNCGEANVPRCDAHIIGSESTATGRELRSMLRQSFGDAFLRRHTFQAGWNETQQRHSVQALLTALKSKYIFYKQQCLALSPELASCNTKAASEVVGRIACDNQVGREACVYAEVRLCGECAAAGGNTTRFFEYARYHGPLQLFRTAHDRDSVMGQCEEFSRAGYALLSALGYEARYVLDFTDHVWIEVRLPHGPHGKWVHADPSEGVLDNPLMYEDGWGKQLTMIFAFTQTKIEHVTSRYTNDYAATVQRRGIAEEDLTAAIAEVNARLQHELPLQPFGFTAQPEAAKPSLQEVALWSHFEKEGGR
mmetsp:Transcript_57433/g.136527  ORF Transcript_57433/g.136527 Transcript_57433/m.136527 type:complete len:524 (+) Transcript_57433:119-1690(+)